MRMNMRLLSGSTIAVTSRQRFVTIGETNESHKSVLRFSFLTLCVPVHCESWVLSHQLNLMWKLIIWTKKSQRTLLITSFYIHNKIVIEIYTFWNMKSAVISIEGCQLDEKVNLDTAKPFTISLMFIVSSFFSKRNQG